MKIKTTVPLSMPASARLAKSGSSRPAPGRVQIPMMFEINRGQTDSTVKFLSRARGYGLFLTDSEAVLVLHKGANSEQSSTLRLRLPGGRPQPEVAGLDELPAVSHHYYGKDRSQWRENISNFARVKYRSVYPGIDLVYHNNAGELEFDFEVAAGADPAAITMEFAGAERLEQRPDGALAVFIGGKELTLQQPVLYQEKNGVKQPVDGTYVLKAHNQVAFACGAYDRSLPLVIDPTLVYSTYIGGSDEDDECFCIMLDSSGNMLVTGRTFSSNYPSTNGTASHGDEEIFVTKLNPSGSAILYSTHVGAASRDGGHMIAIDSMDRAYVTGATNSSNFPTTAGAFDETYNGSNECHLIRLSTTGTLEYATYIGGSAQEKGFGIRVDSSFNVYIMGYTQSTDFPVSGGAFQTTKGGATLGFDAFVIKLNPQGLGAADRVFATFLGGNGEEGGIDPTQATIQFAANAIAIDSSGNSYITGTTNSTNFPLLGAFQGTISSNSLFRSTNSAGAWSTRDSGITTRDVRTLALTGATMYAGTEAGMFKSTDSGANWSASSTGITNTDIVAVVINSGTPATVYAATTGGGVFKSTDSGANWAASNTGLTDLFVRALVIDPVTPATLYAGTASGIFKSTDSGANWAASNTGLTNTDVQAVAIDAGTPATLYAGTNGGGVFKTTNLAGNWAAANSGITNLTIQAVSVNGTTVCAGTSSGLFVSTTSGGSWSLKSSAAGLTSTFVRSVVIDPVAPATIYAGTLGGVYKSTNTGTAFSQVNSGLGKTQIKVILVDPVTNANVYEGGPAARDVFVTKLNSTGTALIYSSYLGGPEDDVGFSIGVDSSNNAYISGETQSAAFPVTAGVVQTTYGGLHDVFVAKINAAGSAVSYATFLGGTGEDRGRAIAVDSSNNAYVTGLAATNTFPTTSDRVDTFAGGGGDAFATKLNSTGTSLLFSTFLGGTGQDLGVGITQAFGTIYVCGLTASDDFNTAGSAVQTTRAGFNDVFVSRIVVSDPPTIAIADATIAEAGTAVFNVTLSAATSETVTVNFATANGTATSSSDYTSASGTLTFNFGETSKTINVTTLFDTLNEDNETFVVNLSGATFATIADNQATGTITDDDPVPTLSINDVPVAETEAAVTASFTVTLSAASGKTVTVNYATANGTATAGVDYTAASGTVTFNPGQTTRPINITVLGDTLDEDNETYVVNLSSPANATIADNQGAGTINDNDALPSLSIADLTVSEGNVGTSSATFTITLTPASGRTVTVDYATANGSATAGSDYTAASGTLTFNAGVTTQTLNVTITGDYTVEAAETFVVNLLNESNATIGDNQATGTISNDDGPGTLQFSVALYTVAEAGGTATITVNRVSGATGTVTVAFAASAGTATDGSDFTAASGALTFGNGVTSQTFSVAVLDDSVVDAAETISLVLSNPGGGATLGTPNTATLTITDDDITPSITSDLMDSGTAGAPFDYTITASGTGTITFSTSALPPGLGLAGPVISGTPTSVGSFTVTLTATSAAGSDSKTLVIVINAASETDSDGDGFSDDIEKKLGTSPTDATSTPFGGAPAPEPESFNVSKLAVKLNFAKPASDSVTFSGDLPADEALELEGEDVIIEVGGVVQQFNLDAKGGGKTGNDSIKIAAKPKNGAAKYSVKLNKGDFAGALEDDGLVDDNISKSVTLTVTVIFNQQVFTDTATLQYSAKKGKSGKTK